MPAAAGADDDAGQEERRGWRSPFGPLLAALGEERLDVGEELLVDEVGVRAVVEGVSEEDFAHVDGVAQHGEDGRVAPGTAGLCRRCYQRRSRAWLCRLAGRR